jgi:heptosyltransferase I
MPAELEQKLNTTGATDRRPDSICLLRLSALGDVTHMLPVVNRLRLVWPDTRLTWIIGKFEYKLVHDLPDIEFITFDKKAGWRGMNELRKKLRGRRFDCLLHMQVSLRANLVSTLIRAPTRIGFDRARSRDFHGAFVNRRIPAGNHEHVVDAFQRFVDALNAPQADLNWTVPVTETDHDWARQQLGGRPSFIISPCSSHALRNWNPASYAEVADHVANRYALQVVLCGGPGSVERFMGNAIRDAAKTPLLDLIGSDTIKRLLALLAQSEALLSPDSGPAHMATCTGTPVIGLHAASNPKRSGPYCSQQWCVDAYALASRRFLQKPADEIRWGTKIEKPGVMDLISVAAVCERIDALARAQGWRTCR